MQRRMQDIDNRTDFVFEMLVPKETRLPRRIVAAQAFSKILQLASSNIVQIQQDVSYGPISIALQATL